MGDPTRLVTAIVLICFGWSSGSADAIASSSPPEKYSPIRPDLPQPKLGSRDGIQSKFQAQNFWSTGITESVESLGFIFDAPKTEVQNTVTETLPTASDELYEGEKVFSSVEESEHSNASNLLVSSKGHEDRSTSESFSPHRSLNISMADRGHLAGKATGHGLSNVTSAVRKEPVNKIRKDDNPLSESRNDSNLEREKGSADSAPRSKALKGNLTSAKLRPFGITAEYLMTITLRNGDQKSLGRGRRYTTNKTTPSKEEGSETTPVLHGNASVNHALVNDTEMPSTDFSPAELKFKANGQAGTETVVSQKPSDVERKMGAMFAQQSKSGVSNAMHDGASENKTGNFKALGTLSEVESPNISAQLFLTEASRKDAKPSSNITAINHLNLALLEEELAKKRNSEDLLLAISILQHHPVPDDKFEHQNLSSYGNFLFKIANSSEDQTINLTELSKGSTQSDNVAEADSFYSSKEEKKYTEELIKNEDSLESYEKYEKNPLMPFTNIDVHPEKPKDVIKTDSFTAALPNTMFVDGQLPRSSGEEKDIDFGKKYSSEMLPELPESLYSSSGIGFLPNDIMLSSLVHNQRASSSNAKEIGEKKATDLVSASVPLPGRPQISHGKVNGEKSTKWLILVMDGDCGIISKRMNTFVMFLKAALSAKLDTKFDDIVIMSVFCDNTFMVNISLETSLYSKALTQLQALAEANTTLLEISGEIFYLEKVLTQDSKTLLSRLKGSESGEDVELIVYIAVGCVCAFILLSVFILTVISICNQEDSQLREVKTEPMDRSDFPIRKPNVIYSHKFTQELNPEKYRLTPFEDSSLGGLAPSDCVSFDAPRFGSERAGQHSAERCCDRKAFITPSSSKIQLLEEVQEEDEEDFEDGGVLEGDEDYHEEEEDVEDLDDDEDDEFIIESMTRPLHAHHHHHHHHHHHQRNQVSSPRRDDVHTTSCCHEMSKSDEPFTGNFDNPCYDR